MDIPRFNDLGKRFHDVMSQRILDTDLDVEQRNQAMALLFTLVMYKKPKVAEVSMTQAEIVELKDMEEDEVLASLTVLESIGAIRRARQGQSDVIYFERDGW